MANRYWVGGSGTWNSSNTAKWSATSGGAGGASVPTSADSVFFDSASSAGSYTVTLSGSVFCLNFNIDSPSTGSVSFAASGSPTLSVSGNFDNVAGSVSFTLGSTFGGIQFVSSSSASIFAGGVNFSANITFDNASGNFSINDSLTTSRNLTLTSGTVNIGSQNVTAGTLKFTGSGSKTLNLGSGTLTLRNQAAIDFTGATNFTFNAGTSNVILSNASGVAFSIITGDPSTPSVGVTFNNLTIDSPYVSVSIYNQNTYNDLTINPSSTTGPRPIIFYANQTILGTLTSGAGANALSRRFFKSSSIGIRRILSCNAAVLTDCDFQDIGLAGFGAPASGTRLGDASNNSGIIFTPAKTVWWNTISGGNWGSNNWATTVGGTPDLNNFPLAQDDVIFEVTGLNSGQSVLMDANWLVGGIDMSARTSSTMTLNVQTSNIIVYGNWTNGTGTTVAWTGGSTATITFSGTKNKRIVSAGKDFPMPIIVSNPGGITRLGDNFSCQAVSGPTDSLQISSGTFDSNGYNVNVGGASVTGSATVIVNAGTWTMLRGSWTVYTFSGTITGNGTIAMAASSPVTFAGGDVSYTGITLALNGSGTVTVTGSNSFQNISNLRTSGAASLFLTDGTTQTVSAFTYSGNATDNASLTSGAGKATLLKTSGEVSISKASIQNITATGGANWYAGYTSTDLGGNTGWLFFTPTVGKFLFLW